MTIRKIFGLCMLTVATVVPVKAQEFTLRNRIDVQVHAEVEVDNTDSMFYRYVLENREGAEQRIWSFQVIMRDDGLVEYVEGPDGWFDPGIKPKGLGYSSVLRAVAYVNWGAPLDAQIVPASTQKGFVIRSKHSLPGIIDYYVEGYAPPPKFEPGHAPEVPLPGYHDVSAYGPGVVGRIIGPVKRVEPLIPAVFVDYVISLKHEAARLGWIKNKGLVRSLDAKLDSAKVALVRGHTKAARNTLRALLNELKAQKNKGVAGEAYSLLFFNLRHLMANL